MQGCVCYSWSGLTQTQGPLCPSPQQREGWEGDTAGTADPKGISQTMWHHAQHIKLGEEEGMFGIMGFVFPSHHYMWWSPAFMVIAEHLPAHGQWWMNSLFCFAFALPVKLSWYQPISLLTSLNLSPIPVRGEWASDCCGRKEKYSSITFLETVQRAPRQKLPAAGE